MKKKPLLPSPKTFIAAARVIEDYRQSYACNAIEVACGWRWEITVDGGFPSRMAEARAERAKRYFTALLRPESLSLRAAWYSGCNGRIKCDEGQARNARIFGLNLAAIMAKEGYIPDGF